jgi:thiol-disulfide isomerase/thioredoxin
LPDKEWKGSELAAGGDYQKALLVFYEAGCPGCEELLAKLLAGQELLKSNGIRVVAISADQDEATFEGRSASFPWKDTFCDLKGMNGVNFRRYGVVGTPTVFVIGKSGRIERRLAGLPDDSALSGLVE